MTTASTTAARPSLGDRFAELTVVGVVLIALLLGWALKSSVESRALPFTAGGISAQAPAGWLRAVSQRGEILRVSNPASSGFPTTYLIETEPVAAEATPAQAASLLTLQRGQQLTAYRVLEQAPVTVNGKEAYRVTYAYVEADPDLTRADLPSVVRGVDFVFVSGGRAIVVSFRAETSTYDADYERFPPFLASVQF
jgi:hypothetical protein